MSTLSNQITNKNLFSYQPLPFYDDSSNTSFSFEKKNLIEYKLDLNLYCIKRPQQTCFIRVNNPNLLAWSIEFGDILVVEKNDQINQGDIIVIEQSKQLQLYEVFAKQHDEIILFPLDSKNKTLKISNEETLTIIGTVTNNIHQFKPRKNSSNHYLNLAA